MSSCKATTIYSLYSEFILKFIFNIQIRTHYNIQTSFCASNRDSFFFPFYIFELLLILSRSIVYTVIFFKVEAAHVMYMHLTVLRNINLVCSIQDVFVVLRGFIFGTISWPGAV